MRKVNVKKMIAGFSTALVAAAAAPVAPASTYAAETASAKVYGDADGDGKVLMNDVVLVLQSISNADKYGLNGSDDTRITSKGVDLADVYQRGDGVTPMDALSIQKHLLGLVELPESFKEGYTEPEDPVSDSTKIHLKNTTVEVEGDYATAVGSKVTITHSGTFYVDGTLDDGQIEVAIPDETADAETVKIFLNGVNITGKSAPAILVSNAKNTSINLVDGTENTITDGDTAYSGDNTGDAVIEAKDDLTIKGGDLGTGSLVITANTQGGVSCNNDIKINGGNITVKALNSTDKPDAIKGKTSVTVKSGVLTVESEGDGIKSSKGAVEISGGTVSVKAGNDAVQSGTTIDISGGTVVAGGDRGLTPATELNITGGTVVATATDNQVKTDLMAGTTRTTLLLNCIDDATNEKDGCWKKANAILADGVKVDYTKKYKYVLISCDSIDGMRSCSLTNAATGNLITHTDGSQTLFQLSPGVNVFDNVDPAGTVKTEPNPVTPETTEGYTITLDKTTIATNAPSDAASVSGGVLTISKEGEYTVTGEAEGVQIVVDVDKTAYPDSVVKLNFAGAKMTNSTTAPVYVASIGDEVQIIAKKGTENVISDGTSHTQTYTDSDGNQNTVEGAIFARDDIKFKGAGSLTVNGNQDDAIVCKNDIKIYNGVLTVNALDDGIRGKDSVTIGDDAKSDGSAVDYSNLKVTVNTTQSGDGIKATSDETGTDKSYGVVTINGGTVDIKAYADGVQAEQGFVMNGGDVNIYTYQGSSYTGSSSAFGARMDGNPNKSDISAKGIKAVGLYDAAGTTWQSKGDIVINGGTLTVDSSDDCVHCGGDMTITGGNITLATADDGLHADHNLTIGKGSADTFDDVVITVTKAYEGVEGLNIVQNSGTVLVTSTDDGFNAAGGADSSGSGNPGGPGGPGRPGGQQWGQGGMSSNNSGVCMTFNGGLALVNVTDGDHDGYDSNGDIKLNGGIQISNGNEAFDCGDGGNTISVNGSTWVSNCRSGGMQMGQEMSYSVYKSSSVSAGTRVSLLSGDKVIVSFITGKAVSELKAGGANASGASFATGGTVSGGKELSSSDGKQVVYVGGTLSGGTKLA